MATQRGAKRRNLLRRAGQNVRRTSRTFVSGWNAFDWFKPIELRNVVRSTDLMRVEPKLMADNIVRDNLVLIKIEGMHCHRCEESIQKILAQQPGVREVEVDFASRQASVLFDDEKISVSKLMELVNDAGYQATGFTQNHGRPKLN
jgi:copper chaperone CopZ